MLTVLWFGLLAAAPGPFDIVFNPESTDKIASRKALFEQSVKAKGYGRAVKSFRGFEKAVEAYQKKVDKSYEIYLKLANAYWSYRQKNPRAEAEQIPANLNRPFLDAEKDWKRVTASMRKLIQVQAWAPRRIAELLALNPDKKATAALIVGLKHRNPYQRLRCANMLRGTKDKKALAALAGRVRSETMPGVTAAVLEAHGGVDLLKFGINHTQWQVRAGAIRALKDNEVKRARLGLEEGRLREDLGEKPGPTSCFGVPTSSRRIVFCFDSPKYLGPLAVNAIKTLPPNAVYGIVIFGGRVQRWKKKLVTGQQEAAIRFIEKTKTTRGADVLGAARVALDMGADTIFLMTAGGPGGAMYAKPLQVGPQINAYNRLRGVRIHCLGPSGARNGFWLQNVAKQFGGTCKGE